MIRVFATKTDWTPTDDFAFYDEPPLYLKVPKKMPVKISVTFTWDIKKGNRLCSAWMHQSKDVSIGGPSIGGPPGDFIPGRFLKEGITITSRGCPKKCPWCLVSQREGGLREINIAPGYIIQDNNLLACSHGHIEKVFEMLSRQKRAAQFKGGLDVDYLGHWHIDLMKQIRIGELWIACDSEKGLAKLPKARDLLGDWPIDKRRCYVLVGYEGDTPEAAQRRCERIYDNENGFLPFAQYYQLPTAQRRIVTKEWHFTVRKWSRPAAYRSKK